MLINTNQNSARYGMRYEIVTRNGGNRYHYYPDLDQYILPDSDSMSAAAAAEVTAPVPAPAPAAAPAPAPQPVAAAPTPEVVNAPLVSDGHASASPAPDPSAAAEAAAYQQHLNNDRQIYTDHTAEIDFYTKEIGINAGNYVYPDQTPDPVESIRKNYGLSDNAGIDEIRSTVAPQVANLDDEAKQRLAAIMGTQSGNTSMNDAMNGMTAQIATQQHDQQVQEFNAALAAQLDKDPELKKQFEAALQAQAAQDPAFAQQLQTAVAAQEEQQQQWADAISARYDSDPEFKKQFDAALAARAEQDPAFAEQLRQAAAAQEFSFIGDQPLQLAPGGVDDTDNTSDGGEMRVDHNSHGPADKTDLPQVDAAVAAHPASVETASAPVSDSSAPAAQAPAETGGTHTVVPGDTMWDIAQAHHMQLQDLITLNPQIADPHWITPGEQINLGGTADTATDSFPTSSSYDTTTTNREAVDKTPGGVDIDTTPASDTANAINYSATTDTDPTRIHE